MPPPITPVPPQSNPPQPETTGSATAVVASDAKQKTSLDSIRFLIKRHQVRTKKTMDKNVVARNKAALTVSVPPPMPTVTPAALVVPSLTPSRPVPPAQAVRDSAVDEIVDDVDALSVSYETGDEQMEDMSTIDNPPSTFPVPESIPSLDSISAPASSVLEVDEGTSNDELNGIRILRSQKQSNYTSTSSAAENDTFELMYPEHTDVAVSLWY